MFILNFDYRSKVLDTGLPISTECTTTSSTLYGQSLDPLRSPDYQCFVEIFNSAYLEMTGQKLMTYTRHLKGHVHVHNIDIDPLDLP